MAGGVGGRSRDAWAGRSDAIEGHGDGGVSRTHGEGGGGAAARLAFRRDVGKITMALLEEALTNTKPSLTVEQIRQHEAIRDQFEGNKPKKQERRRVGF